MNANWDTHEGAYIIYALVSEYTFFNNKKALDAAKKYADLLIQKKVKWITGLEDAFLALHKATLDKKYLHYCTEEFGLESFKNGSVHNSRHVYGYMERTLMQLKLYDIQPDSKLLYKPHVAVEFLVNLDALDAIGASGIWEHFNTSNEGNDCNGETCATAYIIWLMDHLLKIENNPFYGDIMERSIYNALFAAQSPDGRKLRYFTDYESKRKYYPDDYFCCPNNFRRIMSDLPSLIYYQSKQGIVVNLYTESSVSFNVKNKEVSLSQHTNYPTSGKVKIIIDQASNIPIPIFLRIPLWCDSTNIEINQVKNEKKIIPGTFFEITRTWKSGDVIDIDFDMKWRFIKGRQNQYDKVALMRGPVVYCLSSSYNADITEVKSDVFSVDPRSISDPMPDTSFRVDGLKCQVQALNPKGHHVTAIFSEFIDPNGVRTFFKILGKDTISIDDELVSKHY
jgi:uncharacterized protein